MENQLYCIKVQLKGIRPMMFDRYAGDNSTQLPTVEKMYLTENRQLIMPAINVLSLLAAENGKSVCRQFFGKNGKTIALGISSYCNVTPFEIPIMDDSGEIFFTAWNKQISVHKAVARLAKGIRIQKNAQCWLCPGICHLNLSTRRTNIARWKICVKQL